MSLPDPIVLLDARARYVHPAFTCDRASPKWLFGPDGQRHRVPENAMPWEYDPVTGELLGLRVENAQTNMVPNTDISTWTTSNTTVTGESNGWYRVEATSTGEANRSVKIDLGTVTQDQYYTCSVDLRAGEVQYGLLSLSGEGFRPGSSLGVRVAFDLLNKQFNVTASDEVDVIFCEFSDIGGGAVRFSFCARAFAAENSSMYVYLYHRLSNGSIVSDLSAGDGIYVRAPQVSYSENAYNTYPMSHIVTTGSAAQTQRDYISAPIQSVVSNIDLSKGTLVADAVRFIDYDRAAVFSLHDGSPGQDERIVVEIRNNTWHGSARTQGNQIYQSSGVSAPIGQRGVVAVAFDINAGVIAVSANGSPARSEPFTWSQGATFSHFWLGRFYSGGTGHTDRLWNGWIRRVVYYPQRLSNADLQSLTAIQE